MSDAAAAAVRSSVERGDPLALRRAYTMGIQVEPSFGVALAHLAPLVAGADEAVAVDAARYAPDERVQFTPLAGEDSAAMEHERQSRLSRWQAIGSKR